MIARWLSDYVERRTAQLDSVTIESADSKDGPKVLVRYSLASGGEPVAVFGAPLSSTPARIVGGNYERVKQAAGVWQVSWREGSEERFVDFACHWPKSLDEFRVWADVPQFGLKSVSQRPVADVKIGSIPQGTRCSFVLAGSSPSPVRAATLVRTRGPVVDFDFTASEPRASARPVPPEARRLVEACRELSDFLAAPLSGRLVHSPRAYNIAADHATVGVLHQAPFRGGTIGGDILGDTFLRWELASLWWGGCIQARDGRSSQLLLSLRAATVLATTPVGGAASEFLDFVATAPAEVSASWRDWSQNVVRDTKDLLQLGTGELRARLGRAFRELAGRRVSSELLQSALKQR